MFHHLRRLPNPDGDSDGVRIVDNLSRIAFAPQRQAICPLDSVLKSAKSGLRWQLAQTSEPLAYLRSGRRRLQVYDFERARGENGHWCVWRKMKTR
jgi:hypothetical protein